MDKLSEEQIMANRELVFKLIEKLPSEPVQVSPAGDSHGGYGRRERVKAMLESKVGDQYFMAPASSRVEYHSCFPGGLVQHSLNLLKNLRKLADALCPGKYPVETLIFVALFHDLGKAGDETGELYVPNPSDWHVKKGMLFETNKNLAYMPTSERGLYILQKYGIELSTDEYLAIRLNDGMYDETNKNYRMKEPELALLVHWADMWATKQEKPEVSG